MKNFMVDLFIFWKEYWVSSSRFLRKHWLGSIVAVMVYALLVALVWWWPIVTYRIREVRRKVRESIRITITRE